MTSTLDTAAVNSRIASTNDPLDQRVRAHLDHFGLDRLVWTGKGSVTAYFTTDLNVTATDTRFAPLMVNWSATFRATDGAIYLNVPAAWRRVSREAGEGEAEVKTMTAPMKDLLLHLAAGATVEPKSSVAVYPDLSRFEHFKYGTFSGLIDRKYVELTTVADADGYEKRVWVISDDGLTAVGLPPKSVKHDYERFNVGDHIVRKSDKVEFVVTAVDGDFISGERWYGVEVPAGARRAIGQPDTKVSARVELIERAHRKHFARMQDGEAAPVIDPIAPIPAHELENADELHGDIGTLVSDDAPLTLPDAAIVNASEPLSEEYVYISLARPVWRGETVPSEGFVRSFEARHPVWSGAECAVYSRKLGRAELERYELRPYSYNAYEFTVGQRVLWLENDDVYEVTGRDDGRYHLRHECGDVQQYIPEIKLAAAIERTAPVMTVTIEATGKEGVRLHPAPCGYPEYLCTCGLNDGDGQDEPPAPEQSADPIYQDYIGVPIRVNDWVQTPAGLKGSIAGFTREHMAAVALMFESKSFDASTDIHDYLTHTLRKIDPPTPKDDPINYDAYNGGLADAALEALVQSDIERAEKVDPYAWATPAKRGALEALLARKHVYPQICEPSTTPDVWRMEDAWKVKTMQRTLDKIGGELVGRLEQDWNGDEPYCVALFKLEVNINPDYEPYPSKRQTKPAADPNSIHAQYDALHATLPGATFLLIQVNGDEWHAYMMDANLLRRYAPLCRFSPQTVNNAGEQWDKLTVPAGVLDELVTLATEGGLTLALASIVRDEPGALPLRDVTEIHRPGEPVQYVGKEAPPTEWETEADDEPPPEPAPKAEPAAPSKLDMTPELMAAKIRLQIVGGLRLGLATVVPQDDAGWYGVKFTHGFTQAFTLPALRTCFEVKTFGGDWIILRPLEGHGSAIEQATAVVSALPDLTAPFEAIADAFADAKAKIDAFMAATEPVEPTTLLSEADETALIETLRAEHADIAAEALGVTQFLLNVIARMRQTATVAAPY